MVVDYMPLSEMMANAVREMRRSMNQVERWLDHEFWTEPATAQAAATEPRQEQPETPASEATAVEPDPEVLETPSDVLELYGIMPEEYVCDLLAENGGKMRQQELKSHTDWTGPTVSRFLQQMEAEDEIVRVQIGREKVIFLPEAAPTQEIEPSSRQNQPTLAGS